MPHCLNITRATGTAMSGRVVEDKEVPARRLHGSHAGEHLLAPVEEAEPREKSVAPSARPLGRR